MKNGDNSLRLFEVRRRSRWPGPFHEERLGGRGPWQPVGTRAAEALRRCSPDIRERILRRRARREAEQLAQAEAAVRQARTDKARAYFIRRRDKQRARAGRRVTLRTDAHLPLSEAAAHWWPALDEVRRHKGHVTRDLAERWWADKVWPWWVSCYPPFGTRGETTQAFFLWTNEVTAAFVLSCAFGLAAGRLWRCRICEKPFVRPPRRLNQGACSVCHHEAALRTAAGLPRSIAVDYQEIRKRYDQRVARGRMTPAERDRRLTEARRDARRVPAEMAAADWRTRHDHRDRRGRPRVASTAQRGMA